MICKFCGSEISGKSVFCSQCGRKLGNAKTGGNPMQNYSAGEYNEMLEYRAIKEDMLQFDAFMKLSGHQGIIDEEAIDNWGWLFF